jgi:hypothetical protein
MDQVLQRFSAVFRQIASVAAIVVGAIPQLNLPNAVRAPLIALGGIILAVEHYVADPSTRTTTTTTPASKPASPAPPA